MGMGVVGGGMPPPGVALPGMGMTRPVGVIGGPVYTYGQQQAVSAPPSQPMPAATPEDATARLEKKVRFLLLHICPSLDVVWL